MILGEKCMKWIKGVIFGGVLLYAFWVLSSNSFYGIPYIITHPDVPEKFHYFSALLGRPFKTATNECNVLKMGYVSIDYYVYVLIRGILANFRGIENASVSLGYWQIVSFMRIMAAIYGVIAVMATILIGRKMFRSIWVGFISGILLVNIPQFIMYAHCAHGAVPAVAFSLLAFLFALRIYERHKIWDYMFFGIFAGIGTSCEIYTGVVGLVGIIAHFSGRENKLKLVVSGYLWLMIFFSLIGFGIGAPRFFFYPRDVFAQLLRVVNPGRVHYYVAVHLQKSHTVHSPLKGITSKRFVQAGDYSIFHSHFFHKYLDPVVYWRGVRSFVCSAFGMGKSLDEQWKFYTFRNIVNLGYLVIVVVSLVIFWIKRKRRDVSILLFYYTVIYFVMMVLYAPYYIRPRDTVGILPYISLCIGYFTFTVWQGIKKINVSRLLSRVIVALLIVATLSPFMYDGLVTRYLFSLGETRMLARNWWYNNVPPHSKVYMEVGAPPSFVRPGNYDVIGFGGQCGLSGYIITDERVNYKKDIDQIMINKCHYIPVKSFVTMFLNMWNADVHIFKSDYADILPMIDQPRFIYKGLRASRVIFYSKRDVNQDEDALLCREWEPGLVTIVSPNPVDTVGLLFYGMGRVAVKNGSFYKEVDLGVPWDVRKHKDRLLLVKPERRYPFFKYFYEFRFKSLSDRPFVVKVLTKKRDIARYLLRFGRYREAVEILKRLITGKNATPGDYVDLILSYYKLKNYEDAVKVWVTMEKRYASFWRSVDELALQGVNASWLREYERIMRVSPQWMCWNRIFYGVSDFEKIGAPGGKVVYPCDTERKVVKFTLPFKGKWSKIWTQGYVNGGLFHKGWYRAYFFIKPLKATTSVNGDTQVGEVDVLHHFLWRFYGRGERRVIRVKDLKDGWNLVEFDFYAPLSVDGFELRFHYMGGIPVYFGGVKVVPDYRRHLLDLELRLYSALLNCAKKLNRPTLMGRFKGIVDRLQGALK